MATQTGTLPIAARATLSFSGVNGPPPLQATLLSPASGASEDLAGTPTFTWAFNSPQGLTQTAYGFWRLASTDTTGKGQWWDAATSAWVASVVPNTGTAGSVTFPANAWADGISYTWGVLTVGSNGAWSPLSLLNLINAVAAPVVTITSPTGTVTVATPPVSWTAVVPSGVALQSYEVIVYSAAQAAAPGWVAGSGPNLYDSGLQNSLGPDPGPPNLPNATGYVAAVQVTTAAGVTSAWATSTFAVAQAVTLSAPSVIATTTSTGGVQLAIQSNDPSTDWANENVSVEVAVNGGAFSVLPGGAAVPVSPSTGQVTITDATAGAALGATSGASLTYRVGVLEYHNPPAGARYTSPKVTRPAKKPAQPQWLILNPQDWAQLAFLTVTAWQVTRTFRQTAHSVLGIVQPIIKSDVAAGHTYSATCVTTTAAAAAAIESIFLVGSTLLLASPYGDVLWVWFTQLQETLMASAAADPYRTWTLSFTETSEPTVILPLPVL